jgi:uncharacterized protein YebE (UPF0316 family)
MDIKAWIEALPPAEIAALIFGLRTFDLTIATLRVLIVVHGRRGAAWVFGFIQATSFALGAATVLANLQNPINLLAYAAGFATGNVIGITIQSRLIPGFSLIRIISSRRGNLVTEGLRESGHGVTEIAAKGLRGTVSLIYCFVPRHAVRRTASKIRTMDPESFMTVLNVRQLRGGWWA